MTNFYYAASYKNKIINLLLKSKDFIRLINPSPSDCEYLDIIDVLLGGEWMFNGKQYKEKGHVFDYDFVAETTTDVRTYIFVETDIEYVRQRIFTDFNLYVYIFTSKNLVRITDTSVPTVQQVKDMGYVTGTYANRIDVLCDIVDRILNGNDKIQGIGSVVPADRGFCTLYCPNNNYYGKRLKYNITNLNEYEDYCGD